MSWCLRLRQHPGLRLDLRALQPAALAVMSAAEVARLPIGQGRVLLPLGEFFEVQSGPGEADLLVLQGDLSMADQVGAGLDKGQLRVEGPVGHHAGAGMRGGSLLIEGHAGLLAACEMAGGTMTVTGHVGDFAAGARPGSADGMRGGTLLIGGNAGQRLADRMRRGTVLVAGDAGDFLASRMVAGTVALAGRAGAHVAYGMRRGSLVFAGTAPAVSPTFVPAIADAPVFWQLLARDLARHGGPWADLPGRRIQRHRGDLAVAGQGELILAA